ncbi:MAG TPA: DUF362 domain-containing protein [Polyangia bacterium]
MSTRDGSTRREFLTQVAIGAAVLGLPAVAGAQPPPKGPKPGAKAGLWTPAAAAATRFEAKGTVVRVTHPGSLGGNNAPSPELARQMVDRAVMELTGQAKPQDAWAQFVQASDTVLLKPNGFGFPGMAAHPATTFAIVAALREIGVPDGNIVIYDQYQSRMGAAGYKVTLPTAKGVRVLSSKQVGYDPKPRRHPMGRVNFALPVLWASVIIDIPVMKDHDLSGVTCAMKNMTHGVVQTPGALHRDGCAAIPGVWALPEIKDKVKLVLCDGYKLLCDGGPHDRPRMKVPFDSVLATTDPVAMDRLAWDYIEEVRKAKGKPPLAKDKAKLPTGRAPRFIEAAAAKGLGVGAREQIKLIEQKV